MRPIDVWTGFEAKQLREALRLTVVDFAALLGISPRTVNKWESRKRGITPLPEMQAVLDTALAQAPGEVHGRFSSLIGAGSTEGSTPSAAPGDTGAAEAAAIAVDTAQPRNSAGQEPGAVTVDARSQTIIVTGKDLSADTPSATGAASALVEFTRSDMATRREFLDLSLRTGAALVTPVRRWAATVPLVALPHGKAGEDEIHELERAVALFRRWDASGSGGLHRKAVVGQLNAVAESLNESVAQADRRRLSHVAAELSQLAGWMTFDSGLHVAAQHYFLFALQASEESGSPDLAAKIVGDMAQLSKFLGHNEDSLAMLKTALATLPRGANPLVRSELAAHQACAHARFGPAEASAARRSVDASLDAFEEATTQSRTNWLLYMDRAEVNSLAASAYIQMAQKSDGSPQSRAYVQQAESFALQANTQRQTVRARSRVFDEIRLSKIRLAQREPAEAAAVACNALRLAENVRSSSAVTRLGEVCNSLIEAHGDLHAVREFRSELIDYVRTTAPGRERELRV